MKSKNYLCGFASNDLFLSKFRYLKEARKRCNYAKNLRKTVSEIVKEMSEKRYQEQI